MGTYKKHEVYEKLPIEECWKETGKAPIGVKWVDTNKGDKERPEYRCRLVAKEIKKDKREDLFAATPPLEAKKMLFSLWASMPGMCLDFGDVVRAYFHAKARRKVYVELSKEDYEEGKCGLLRKAKYGTRDAAQNWELEYTEMMTEAGFRQGAYSACVFYHEENNVRVVVHGDDFTVLGPSKGFDWFRGVVQQRMEMKFKNRLERGKPGAVKILNRIATVTENGLEYIRRRELQGSGDSRSNCERRGAYWRSVSWRRNSVSSGGGPRELLRPGQDGHAVRSKGDQQIHVEARGTRLEKCKKVGQVPERQQEDSD